MLMLCPTCPAAIRSVALIALLPQLQLLITWYPDCCLQSWYPYHYLQSLHSDHCLQARHSDSASTVFSKSPRTLARSALYVYDIFTAKNSLSLWTTLYPIPVIWPTLSLSKLWHFNIFCRSPRSSRRRCPVRPPDHVAVLSARSLSRRRSPVADAVDLAFSTSGWMISGGTLMSAGSGRYSTRI